MLERTNGNQPVCCGTCAHWRAGQPPMGEPAGRSCPVLQRLLPGGHLKYWTCSAWRRDYDESFAVELWSELGGEP